MPRRQRSSNLERADPNLTPLLDVVLQLITFFMMLVYFGTRIEGATDAIRLPEAPAALPGSTLGIDRLVVAIDAQGRFLGVDRPAVSSDDPSWWREEARRRREGLRLVGESADSELPTVVVIRADRELPYGRVRRVLREAQAQGFARFTLVVLQEDPR